MHLALIIDEERLAHEQATLNRLVIGLLAEGVRVTRIVPESLASSAVDRGEQRVALAARLTAPTTVVPWMRRDRALRLADAMEKSTPDVLYAVGEGAWAIGADLARAVDRPLLVDVWSAGQIRRVPRGRAARSIGGYVAPTAPLAVALRQRVDPSLVCHVPMGVAIPPAPRDVLAAADRSIALAVIGGGRDVPAYRAMLAGMSRVIRETPQAHAFVELDGPNEHEIWRHARRLELLERLTATSDAAAQRSLLVRCDILLMPERYGDLRSITLEAMAVGMPVVAADDPFLDMLIDGESALIVRQPEADDWGRSLARLVGDPPAARDLGRGGRQRVATDHASSEQVARLCEVLERVVRGGAYPFARDEE